MANAQSLGTLGDLLARQNQINVRREDLARRYPGSFAAIGPADPAGQVAPPVLVQEWQDLTAQLARVTAAIEAAQLHVPGR